MFDYAPMEMPENAPKKALVLSTLHFSSSSLFSLPCGSIIKIPSREEFRTYAQLPLTSVDRKKIWTLITIISTHGKIDLLLHHKSELEKMGDEINETVHPLKFLAAIFTQPDLKSHMNSIRHDFWKWTNFISGLSKRMKLEDSKGRIQKYLPDFAAEINVPLNELQEYYDHRDWQGLVKHLINR